MDMPPRYKLETLHEAKGDLGFLATMGVIDGHVFASGGMFGSASWLYADNGRSFRSMDTPYSHRLGLRGLFIERLNRIYVVGECGILGVTSDQGRTWEKVDTGQTSCFYRIGRCGSTLLICSDYGLFGSEDDGQSWKPLYKSEGRLLDLFVEGTKVYSLGAGRNLVVYEEGRCTLVPLPSWDTLTAIIRAPDGALLVTGDNGQLLRSDDDGANWEVIAHNIKADFEDIAVVQGHILVVGGRGTLLHSSDNGRTFHALKTSTTVTLWSLAPVANGAYIGCDKGQVMFVSLDVEAPANEARNAAVIASKEPKKR